MLFGISEAVRSSISVKEEFLDLREGQCTNNWRIKKTENEIVI